MRTRKTDCGKRRDPWYRRLSRDERDVYEWLLDQADDAGFVELDSELLAFECKIDVSVVGGCIDTLTKVYQGSPKVLVRESQGGGEALIWIPNYIKIQQNGKFYNPKDNWHSKILQLLTSKGKSFKEVESLCRGWVYPMEGIQRREEIRKDKIEGSVRGDQFPKLASGDGDEDKVGASMDPLYKAIYEEPGFGLTYAAYREVIRSYPGVKNVEGVVVAMLQTAANERGGIKNPFTYFKKWMSNQEVADVLADGHPESDASGKHKDGDVDKKTGLVWREKKWRKPITEMTEEESQAEVEELAG